MSKVKEESQRRVLMKLKSCRKNFETMGHTGSTSRCGNGLREAETQGRLITPRSGITEKERRRVANAAVADAKVEEAQRLHQQQ